MNTETQNNCIEHECECGKKLHYYTGCCRRSIDGFKEKVWHGKEGYDYHDDDLEENDGSRASCWVIPHRV